MYMLNNLALWELKKEMEIVREENGGRIIFRTPCLIKELNQSRGGLGQMFEFFQNVLMSLTGAVSRGVRCVIRPADQFLIPFRKNFRFIKNSLYINLPKNAKDQAKCCKTWESCKRCLPAYAQGALEVLLLLREMLESI